MVLSIYTFNYKDYISWNDWNVLPYMDPVSTPPISRQLSLAKQILRLGENGDIYSKLSKKLAKFSYQAYLMLLLFSCLSELSFLLVNWKTENNLETQPSRNIGER